MKPLKLLVLTICFFAILYPITKTTAQELPFKATYSSDFKLGDSKYSKMILDLWKDWDDNALTRHDYFADTIRGNFSDGSEVNGKTDFVKSAVGYRSTFTSVQSTVHAWVPLYANNQKETVVCTWGQEVYVKTDGTKGVNNLHEVWWFNKDNKITYMRQWEAREPEKK